MHHAKKRSVTRRNKPAPPAVQTLLFASSALPTWGNVLARFRSLPRGSSVELAEYLGLSKQAVSLMLNRGVQPSYERVCLIIQFLESKGV